MPLANDQAASWDNAQVRVLKLQVGINCWNQLLISMNGDREIKRKLTNKPGKKRKMLRTKPRLRSQFYKQQRKIEAENEAKSAAKRNKTFNESSAEQVLAIHQSRIHFCHSLFSRTNCLQVFASNDAEKYLKVVDKEEKSFYRND
jgi:hypothetical protein